ncbi:PREDICTED: erythroid membrane-associated protein-like, partial [Cyprinodon variegatus]|uniref:erythroid membrane-associated protein-like n=1 Tax=Cyprinodon variegatus TaxID=28743 RepID=UPI0007428AD3
FTELKRLQKFSVDVELDAQTAHQHLIISPNGKEVKDGSENQEVADSPERFDFFGSVLGLNSLTTGKSYWEVKVNNYAALMDPPIRLTLEEEPETVGVFVDYGENLLSFYDMTNQSHIYSFSKCSFSDELYPYFSQHMKKQINYEPLIISKVKTY